MNSVRTLQKWFKENITDDGRPYTLDKNQAKIVLDAHKNTIVTARAGSGKTRTIVAKVVYLLTYEKIPPENIIIFSFNRKARAEVNERLTKIAYQGKPLFDKTPALATTFHAFAYKILGGKEVVGKNLLSELEENNIIKRAILKNIESKKSDRRPRTENSSTDPELKSPVDDQNSEVLQKLFETAKQFIARAEQQFPNNDQKLAQAIDDLPTSDKKDQLKQLLAIYFTYKNELSTSNRTNFNQLMSTAAEKIIKDKIVFPFSHIFVDEYQDFSKLFFNLISAIRKRVPDSHLLVVGDDWQAINHFAGSDVKYFANFEHYFPEDHKRLFIPTNYRSGKTIVKNANYFMGQATGDFRGCKAGNNLRAKIFLKNVLFENYEKVILKIINDNPGKSIKILDRNNNLNFIRTSLESYVERLRQLIKSPVELSESTIHRSKGLEADVVILLEIDAKKFPGPDKTGGLFEIFGDTEKNLFLDEARLFYVALTRPKEKLYILSKTTKITKENKKLNFLSYLNHEWIEEF